HANRSCPEMFLKGCKVPTDQEGRDTMPLQDTLDRIREAAKERIPAEARAIMEHGTETLRASGIMQRVARIGQAAPGSTLPNARGTQVGLTDLTARGPVVLSFYRGRW